MPVIVTGPSHDGLNVAFVRGESEPCEAPANGPDLDALAVRLMRALEGLRSVQSRKMKAYVHRTLHEFIAVMGTDAPDSFERVGPMFALLMHFEDRFGLATPREHEEWWRQCAILTGVCHEMLRGHVTGVAVKGGDR